MLQARWQDRNSENMYGLIGNPVHRSLSPEIFRFLFNELNIPAQYRTWEINPESLEGSILGLRGETAGFNVTIPFKQKILSFLDNVNERARFIGAVNCVKNENGRLIGYNTDFPGFIAMAEPYRTMIEHRTGLILGAGGAARAVVYGLLTYFTPAVLYIANRHESPVLSLMNDLSELTQQKNTVNEKPELQQKENILYNKTTAKNVWTKIIRSTKIQGTPLDDCASICPSFIINCLPPDVFEIWLTKHAFLFQSTYPLPIVLDINYFPLSEVSLLRNLPEVRYINGLRMLVVQAVESLKIWTGKNMDPERLIRFLDRIPQNLKE